MHLAPNELVYWNVEEKQKRFGDRYVKRNDMV